jgi:hypothetical protein
MLRAFLPAGEPVSRRRFEMFQYRQVLLRLRQGDSDRDIARSRLMGRPKVAALRGLASGQGWLAPEAALPDDATLSAAVGQARRARSGENLPAAQALALYFMGHGSPARRSIFAQRRPADVEAVKTLTGGAKTNAE